MGDNKISEAVTAAAAAIDELHDEMTDARIGSEVARQFAECAINAALPHLQGEAVPVAIAAGISEFGVLECNLLPGGLELLQSTGGDAKLYLHPQPAELSEVSGNSGELPPLPAMELVTNIRVTCCNNHQFNHVHIEAYTAEQMRQYARAAIAATGKQQVGEKKHVRLPKADLDRINDIAARDAQQAGDVQGSREQFEAWANSANYILSRFEASGEYQYATTACAWQAWRAASGEVC